MSLSTYSELKAAVASWLHRDDLTTEIVDFITLAETTMQTRCKLVDFEASATVTITSGSGSLPSGFAGMRSCYWDGDSDRALKYITPLRYDAMRDEATDPVYYTISGSTIRVSPIATGSLVMTYHARFTPLSDAATSNYILTNYPDAYLYGALAQASVHTMDDANAQKYGALFSGVIDRIKTDNRDRKYAGPLTVQVA